MSDTDTRDWLWPGAEVAVHVPRNYGLLPTVTFTTVTRRTSTLIITPEGRFHRSTLVEEAVKYDGWSSRRQLKHPRDPEVLSILASAVIDRLCDRVHKLGGVWHDGTVEEAGEMVDRIIELATSARKVIKGYEGTDLPPGT
jgi:hypothetical protein